MLHPQIFDKTIGKSRIRIYNEDCLEGMKRRITPGSVDMVVTSPPYNIGVEYGEYDDTISRGQYLDWLESVARQVKTVLKEDGSFFLNMGGKPSDPLVSMEVALRLREIFVLQNLIHWVKSIALDREDMGDYPGRDGGLAAGHYKPVNSPRYLNDCAEFIFHFTKRGDIPIDRLALGVPYTDKSNVSRWKGGGQDLRCRGNTWFIPYKTIRNGALERPHPASFPVKLAEMCVKLHGLDKTKLVLDPFNGIGNAAAACVNLGVDFTGFEIEEDFYKSSIRIINKQRVVS